MALKLSAAGDKVSGKNLQLTVEHWGKWRLEKTEIITNAWENNHLGMATCRSVLRA